MITFKPPKSFKEYFPKFEFWMMSLCDTMSERGRFSIWLGSPDSISSISSRQSSSQLPALSYSTDVTVYVAWLCAYTIVQFKFKNTIKSYCIQGSLLLKVCKIEVSSFYFVKNVFPFWRIINNFLIRNQALPAHIKIIRFFLKINGFCKNSG